MEEVSCAARRTGVKLRSSLASMSAPLARSARITCTMSRSAACIKGVKCRAARASGSTPGVSMRKRAARVCWNAMAWGRGVARWVVGALRSTPNSCTRQRSNSTAPSLAARWISASYAPNRQLLAHRMRCDGAMGAPFLNSQVLL